MSTEQETAPTQEKTAAENETAVEKEAAETEKEASAVAPAAEEAPAEAPASKEAPAEAPASEEAPTEAPASEEAPAEAPAAEETPAEVSPSEESPSSADASAKEAETPSNDQENTAATDPQSAPAEDAAPNEADDQSAEKTETALEAESSEAPAEPTEDAPVPVEVEPLATGEPAAATAPEGEAAEPTAPEVEAAPALDTSDVLGVATLPMGDDSPAPASRLFYVDFVPNMLQAGNEKTKTHPTFEGYKQVFFNINQWLINHTAFKVISIEHTLQAVGFDGTLEADDTIFHSKEASSANWLHCTRVWLVAKDPSDTSPPDSLAYYVCKPMPSGGASEPENLSDLPTTVDLFNAEVSKSIIPGKIISVQTVDYAVGENFKCSDMMSQNFGDDTYLPAMDRYRGVTLIKIIYAHGVPLCEEIGVADFAPGLVKVPSSGKGKVFFEPLGGLLQRTNQWISENDAKTLRVVSVQVPTVRTVDMVSKMIELKKTKGIIPTKAMWHMDSRNFCTTHLKLLRVFYVKLTAPEDREPLSLTTKMFVAPKKDFQTGEPLSSLVGRTNAWLHLADKSVMAAQLLNLEYNAKLSQVDIQETGWVQETKLKYFVQVLLLFLHGSYVEPDKRALPKCKTPVKAVDNALVGASAAQAKPPNKSSTCTLL